MGQSSLQNALNTVLEMKSVQKGIGLLRTRLGPQTDVVLNRVGRTAAPTVAKLHAWCESCAPATSKRREKKSPTKTAVAAE